MDASTDEFPAADADDARSSTRPSDTLIDPFDDGDDTENMLPLSEADASTKPGESERTR